MENKQKFLDSLGRKKERPVLFDFDSAKYVNKYKRNSVWFSKKGITGAFITSNSKIDPKKEELPVESFKCFDSLNHKYKIKLVVYPPLNSEKNCYLKEENPVYYDIKERYLDLRNYIEDFIDGRMRGISMAKVWNVSVIGAVIFGMMLMTMMYRYLGESVSAKINGTKNKGQEVAYEEGKVLGVENVNDEIEAEFITKLFEDYDKFENAEEAKSEMEKRMAEMVKGYPIEKMVPYIAKKDKVVAAFLISIARKESSWGKHVPVLNGQDCYNYWGYRGIRKKMGTGGHTCFDSPEDAVNTVAKRIEFLVSNEKLNTPAKMVVWKCGYDCSWDSKTAVKKWISDVDLYFKKLNK